jgi:protein O-GlcNAc transferase
MLLNIFFVGWCDYLVCDPIACPPELSAAELWRIKQSSQSEGTIPQLPSPLDSIQFDLDADPDPEQETDEWVL